MMSNLQDPPPKRISLKKDDVECLSKDQLIEKWFQQDKYIDFLGTKPNEGDNSELVSLRESEEKLKQQQLEATRRENILVMRLTTKEQEMQEYANQIQELKQGQIPTVVQLRSALLDPAVNLMFERLRKELESTKARLEETQNELSAWKFTPDSNTGKRLMAKCRLLYQENEELGKMISSGRMAKLEGDLALQKNFSEEMKKSQNELDEFLLELDEDVEGMQNTIYYLQQQLKESKDFISRLQQEKQQLNFQAMKDHAVKGRTVSPVTVANPVTVIVKNERAMANGKDSPEPDISCADIGHSEDEPCDLSQAKEAAKDFRDTRDSSPMQIQTLEQIKKEPPEIEEPKLEPFKADCHGSTEDLLLVVDDTSHCNDNESIGVCNSSVSPRLSSPPPSEDNHERLKRTRDSSGEEIDLTQSPKRPKHNGDASPTPIEEGPSVDVDKDTEVQVAEMLVCWASANKGRIESQSLEQTCPPLGNGEVDDSSSVSE